MTVAQQTKDLEKAPKSSQVRSAKTDWLFALACFAATLLVCLLQNLSRSAQELTFVFDSGHYLDSCQKLGEFCRTYLGQARPGAQEFAHLADDLMLDGPVLPIIVFLPFFLGGHVLSYTDSAAAVAIQSVLQAASSTLIYFLAKRLTASRAWSLTCALLWGLYPAAVIGAGRLLPETVTCLILLALVLALASVYTLKAWPANLSAFLGGMFSSLILLAKPALGPAAFLIDLIFLALFQDLKKILKNGALLFVGGVLALAPWMAFTKAATGEAMMTAQRVPVFNIVNGLDQETNGWASVPASPFVRLFSESSGAWPSFVSIVSAQPEATLKMVVQKIPRLWQVPWNDFRCRFLGINAAYQIYWHQILCLFGILGMLAFFLSPQATPLSTKLPWQKSFAFTGYASTAFIFGHLIYILFLSSARYGFTAMPFFVLFAAYFLMKLVRSKKHFQAFALALSAILVLFLWQTDLLPWLADALGAEANLKWLVFALQLSATLAALFFSYRLLRAIELAPGQKSALIAKIAFAFAFLIFAGMWLARTTDSLYLNEWSCRLLPSEKACRRVFAPILDDKHPIKPDWALVVFDGDDTAAGAKVLVNGRTVDQKPESLYLFNSSSAGYSQFQIFSAMLHMPSGKLRQWRAVQVPVDYLSLKGDNVLALQPAGTTPITLFGSAPTDGKGTWNIPSLYLFAPTKLVNSTTSYENRPITEAPSAGKGSLSFLEAKAGSYDFDLAGAPGWQFGQYRILLLLGYGQDTSPGRKAEEKQFPKTTITLAAKPCAIGTKPLVFRFAIPQAVRSLSHLSIQVKGELSCLKGANRANILGTVAEGPTTVFFLPQSPLALNFAAKPVSFSLAGNIHCQTEKEAMDNVELSITSQVPGAQVNNLKVVLQPIELADFAGHDTRAL